MAQYAPQASALTDEQEFLQAYEDVLEKYKGRSHRLMSLLWGPGDDEDMVWLLLDS